MDKSPLTQMGMVLSDTRLIDRDITLQTYTCAESRQVSIPLPLFDVLAIDRTLRAHETHSTAIDWAIMKTRESNRCVILCLTRPRALSKTSIPNLMEISHGQIGLDNIPQDSIARAMSESLHSQGLTTNILIHGQTLTDDCVFNYSCIQLLVKDSEPCFVIDGKAWVQSLRQTLGEIKLSPSVLEIAESPSHTSSLNCKWSEFLVFLKMKRQSPVLQRQGHTTESPSPTIKRNDDETEEETKQKENLHLSEYNQYQCVSHTSETQHGVWKPWMRGIAFGLLFGTLPVWHIITEFL